MEARKFGHLLMVPSYSGHAHFMSALRLARALAKLGVTITVATRHESILRVQSKPSFTELPNFHLADLGGNEEMSRGPLDSSLILKTLFEPYVEKLIADRKAGVLGPTCIMADRFLLWAKEFADQLEIPFYIMCSTGATYARVLQAVQVSCTRGVTRMVDDKIVNLQEVTSARGLEFMLPEDLPWGLYKSPAPYIAIGDGMTVAAGVVVNSFLELEANVISAFQEPRSGTVKMPPLFPVGPVSLLSTEIDDEESFIGLASGKSGSDCLGWLDKQPASSVLYICTGSWIPIFPPQIREIAKALQATEHRFLWVLPRRFDNFTDLKEVLPPGFDEIVGDRGMIAQDWVSQVQVLAHTSVGGFLTHCGWQSCLETVVAGLPVLAWPQGAEQHLNARYLVEALKIGVRLTEKRGDILHKDMALQMLGRDTDTLVLQPELEKAISLLMGEGSRTLRENAQQLRRKAYSAVAAGGSTHKALQALAESFPTTYSPAGKNN